MNKKLGQNFLINGNLRKKIAEAVLTGNPKYIWEIGGGIGALSSEFLDSSIKLDIFEIDKGFITILEELYKDKPHIQVIKGDVRETWPKIWQQNGTPDRIVGNLPYNIGAKIITGLIKRECIPHRAVFTIQKEVAGRLMAKPGEKSYSFLSVVCSLYWDMRIISHLKPGSFYPRPEVTSTAVKCDKKSKFPQFNDKNFFYSFLNNMFISRRKTIKRNLTTYYKESIKPSHSIDAILKALDINPSARIEELTPKTILELSNNLHSAITTCL